MKPSTRLSSLVVLVCVLIGACVLVVAIDYRTIPTRDTPMTRFDAIIVLGNPANQDGTPSPEQRERVAEGVREYHAGVAPRLILTGGAAHNAYTEAHVMAQFAGSLGMPTADIVEESQAQNTVQNIYYSAEIMHRSGWTSAEIVSSPSHLPRTSLILEAFDRSQPDLAIHWQTHAAHWPPEYSTNRKLALLSAEALECLRRRIRGFPPSRFLPSR